jgi:hypothetical protein
MNIESKHAQHIKIIYFGLTTKARACKGASQKEAWELHLMLPEV